MLDNAQTSDFRFRREWPALAIIVLFVIIQMYPFTLRGQALMPDTWRSIHPWARGVNLQTDKTSTYDPVIEYNPWFQYSQTCLKEGRVPHWNPWQFCGAPLYANRLVPFFYPPFVLAELISRPEKLIGWLQFFNLILSGWGMYLLLRRWRLSAPVSAISSCLYLTCGIHFLPFPVWTMGTIGFPWLMWALDGFLERPGLKSIAIAGLIAGIILMIGYPVLVVHFTYFIGIYFIYRWWTTRRLGPSRISWMIPPVALAAVYILGFGVASIANIPAYEYSKQTSRALQGMSDAAFELDRRLLVASRDEARGNPVLGRMHEHVDMVFPINGRGTDQAWQHSGLLVYLLAGLGILGGRPRGRFLGILGLIFAVPIFLPGVYLAIMDFLPGWAVTILPPTEVVNLAAAILAAFGLEVLIGGKWSPGPIGKTIFGLFAVTCIVLTIVNMPTLYYLRDRDIYMHSRFHLYYRIAFILLAALVSAAVSIRLPARWLRWGVATGIVAFSLCVFWYLQPDYSPVNYMPPTPFTQWVKSTMGHAAGDPAGNRLARWGDLRYPLNPHAPIKGPFIPNLQLPYKVLDVSGYDSLVPKRYIQYCTMFEDAFVKYRALLAFKAPSSMYHPRFRDLGVRWIISQGALPEEGRQGCKLVWDDRYDGNQAGTDSQDDFIQVWEVENPKPRAFLTRHVAFNNSASDSPIVEAVNLSAHEINAVVVEDPSRGNRTYAFPDSTDSSSPFELPGGSISIPVDKPETVALSVDAPEECYLVLRDGWFPEWKATIDGNPTDVFAADATFRAVRVPAGHHEVVFNYVPRSFHIGLWITLATLAILLAMAVRPPAGRRDTSDPQP